jgi:hypothetical protein
MKLIMHHLHLLVTSSFLGPNIPSACLGWKSFNFKGISEALMTDYCDTQHYSMYLDCNEHLESHKKLTFRVASTLAPALSSCLTTWSCPICAAIHRGVAPSVRLESGLAPRDNRNMSILKWPFCDAMNNGVARSCWQTHSRVL